MRHTHRVLGLTSTAALLCISSLQAQFPQDNPLLKSAEAQQRIITQRVEGELKEAIGYATRLQAASKIKAVNVLKTALAKLDDPLIPPKFRQEWTAPLNNSIARIDRGEIAAPPAPAVDPVKREVKEAEKALARSIIEERDNVRKTFDKIQALAKGGRSDLAQEEAVDLLKKYPNNPAALIMADQVSMNQRIADAKLVLGQQERGYLLAMRSVDKSAVMPKGDIEFDPAVTKEAMLRSKPKLTAKEQAILKALESPIDVNFKDAPFEDVLKSISKGMNQEILLDKKALQEAMVDSNTPTTLASPRGVLSARTALRKILQDRGLTFLIRDQTIQVVTLEAARAAMVTRVYYLGDIVQGVGPLSGFGGASLNFGPWADLMQTQDNVNKIVEMIKGSLDPDSWKDRGGNGTVTFHFPTMSLIVRQTSEVHSLLYKTLGSGR